MREHFVAGKSRCRERLVARNIRDAFRNQVSIRVVGEGRLVEYAAPDKYWRGFCDVLANLPEGQVAPARRRAVGTVLAFEAVVPVEFFLQVVVEGLERAVAPAGPFCKRFARLPDNDCADGVRVFCEFPEEHEAFAAVAVPAQVEDFGSVRDFGGRVAGREFRHAALVMLADFDDFFERGREVLQVALVLAFNGASCRVDCEVVRAFNGAHVGANRFGVFPERLHVVAIHRETVFVQVDSRHF